MSDNSLVYDFLLEMIESADKILERCANASSVDYLLTKERDILSHHYFDLNAETVYGVCTDEIENVKTTLIKIKQAYKESIGINDN